MNKTVVLEVYGIKKKSSLSKKHEFMIVNNNDISGLDLKEIARNKMLSNMKLSYKAKLNILDEDLRLLEEIHVSTV